MYNNVPKFIETLELSDEELTKYIIGTMSPLERPKSAYSKGLEALDRLKRGRTAADIVKLKEEILATESKDLVALSSDIQKVQDKSTLVVIGNKSKIDKEKDLFDEVYKLY